MSGGACCCVVLLGHSLTGKLHHFALLNLVKWPIEPNCIYQGHEGIQWCQMLTSCAAAKASTLRFLS